MGRRKRQEEAVALDQDPLWYRDAILYELHVRAFSDSNGDGIGDFRGLIDRLDYLHDLGVTALWLLPFYPSPLRDDGYDISDYSRINPIYGDRADFRVFLREAHRRGLRVITELVVNHTSDQHPWFQRARRAKPGDPARDWYVWSDTSDRYKEARIIFKDFEPSNWTWDPVAEAYYWHRFYSHQPDLNYDNPEVHRAIFQTLDFWMAMGIDGLRLDAVPYLYEREGTNCENLPETHAFLQSLRRHVDSRFPGRMLLAEANQWPEDAVAYFGQGDECHMAFHFPVMPRLFMAIRMEDRFPIVDILQQTPPIPDNCQWAMFLRNHDELTLEMVTDEDRDYMYRMYAQDPKARINLGIRRRLAPLLGNNRAKIELMNGLLFSLPGTPVLYYGDEIGMGDNIYLGDRNGVRTPMQWTGERNAGFSRANPQQLYLPVIIDPEYHFGAINVEAQQGQPHSLLWWTKHLIAVRKRYRAFGRGSLEMLHPDNSKVLAFIRRYQSEVILVVANLSRQAQFVELDLSAQRGAIPVEVLGRTPFPRIGELPYLLTLGPHAIFWFELQTEAASTAPGNQPAELPTIEVPGAWTGFLRGKPKETFETVLADYLASSPAYPARGRTLSSVQILDAVPMNAEVHLTIAQLNYVAGDPEIVSLPLAAADTAEQDLRDIPSQAIICRLRSRRREQERFAEALVFDALAARAFPRTCLETVLKRRRHRGAAGDVAGLVLAAAREGNGRLEAVPDPYPMRGTHHNACIGFGDRWVLKMFRHLEEGISPEYEMGRFLTERVHFSHAAPAIGALEYRRGQAAPMTLGIVHGFVSNEGAAWHHTLDALSRYYERVLTEPGRAENMPELPDVLGRFSSDQARAKALAPLDHYADSARLMGQRVAELHLALASAPDDPDFAPEPFSALYQRSLYQAQRARCKRVLEQLRRGLRSLPANAQEDAQAVLAHEEELLRRARSVMDRKLTGMRIRCHGDLQLAQMLYTGRDFVIIGFDAEPLRAASERRLKRSPLRDVASMLRSFHYAARVALREKGLRPEDMPALETWARAWPVWAGSAFLGAYLDGCGTAGFLPSSPEDRALLIQFYLLKRAVAELQYELDHNPERVRIPIIGILEHLGAGSRVTAATTA